MATRNSESAPLKVLFIGNSFTARNDLPGLGISARTTSAEPPLRGSPRRTSTPKRAAVAFDVTAETMMKYYTGTEKKATADDVLGGLASKLLPPMPGGKEGTKGE